MIFNRTLEDVEIAKKIRDEKVKKNIPLSKEDVDFIQKGFFTIEVINRIEQKQQEISEELKRNGYYNSTTENAVWQVGDFFLKSDMERILKNNKILREAFFVYKTTPTNCTSNIYFENINKIEKMLHDLQEMIDDMKSRYKICGTFNCGG